MMMTNKGTEHLHAHNILLQSAFDAEKREEKKIEEKKIAIKSKDRRRRALCMGNANIAVSGRRLFIFAVEKLSN